MAFVEIFVGKIIHSKCFARKDIRGHGVAEW